MAVTVKKILEVIPNDYMGNDRTIFTDERDQEIYTFGKVQEGASYEGVIKTDRSGKLQFKKDKSFNSPVPPAVNQAPLPQAGQPDVFDLARFELVVNKFDEAVTAFSNSVNQLSLLQDKTITDKDLEIAEDFLKQ